MYSEATSSISEPTSSPLQVFQHVALSSPVDSRLNNPSGSANDSGFAWRLIQQVLWLLHSGRDTNHSLARFFKIILSLFITCRGRILRYTRVWCSSRRDPIQVRNFLLTFSERTSFGMPLCGPWLAR